MMIPATIVLSGTMFMFSRLIRIHLFGSLFLGLFCYADCFGDHDARRDERAESVAETVVSSWDCSHVNFAACCGAIGVSMFISILNARQAAFLQNSSNPESITTIKNAMVAGVELVYLISFFITIIAVILAFFVYRAVPQELETVQDK